MKNFLLSVLFFSIVTNNICSTSYYCNPSGGSMNNPGTLTLPWSTLQAVFIAGKTFADGDVIYLMSGNHGFPTVMGSHTSDVIITRYGSDLPVLDRVDFGSTASHWVLDNIEVYRSTAPPAVPILTHPVFPLYGNSLVRIINAASYITISNCYIYSIEDSSGWTADDWNYKAWNGIYIRGSHNTITNCHIKNVNFGVYPQENEYNTVKYCTIENFCGDGLRPGNNTTLEYNVVKDCYLTNGNHPDLIQLYTGDDMTNVIIRGNILIAATTSRPFIADLCHGIAGFDGLYTNCVVENNLVVVHDLQGISFFGAVNCSILNNTVAYNPTGVVPNIVVTACKDGRLSSGNLVRNNLCPGLTLDANVGTVDHNVVSTNYTSDYVDYHGFDFHLKSTSTAINAGIATYAPTIDLEQQVRTITNDAGCYRYLAGNSTYLAPNNSTNLNFKQVGRKIVIYGFKEQDKGSIANFYNAQGKCVAVFRVDGDVLEWDGLNELGSTVAAGLYIVKVYGEQGICVFKFIMNGR